MGATLAGRMGCGAQPAGGADAPCATGFSPGTLDRDSGEYVVHDTDESDGEGIGTSQDTKDITVQ